jgi:low temperature requirement protein LtrA
VRIARNSFSYLHLPMVAGIVLFALGLKETLAHVDVDLEPVPATALCAGTALYLLALSLLKRINYGSFNLPRLVTAVILIALAPLATVVPALLSLALVAVITASLVAYEFTAYAEARDRIRHGT